jgi:hypothetical protein
VINKIVRNYSPNVVQSLSVVKFVRGGGATDEDDDDDDDDDDLDIENSDDEEDIMEEEQNVKKNQKVQVDSKLTKSTIVSTSKVDDKKSKDIKETVSSTLLQMNLPSIKKSKRKSMLRIPYILRALFNPFTVIAMTRGYVASLFNLDYLKEHTSSVSKKNTANLICVAAEIFVCICFGVFCFRVI